MKQLKMTTYSQDSIRKKYTGLFPNKIMNTPIFCCIDKAKIYCHTFTQNAHDLSNVSYNCHTTAKL